MIQDERTSVARARKRLWTLEARMPKKVDLREENLFKVFETDVV